MTPQQEALLCLLLRRLNMLRKQEREASRPHEWKGYACVCQHCGQTALEAKGEIGPCPARGETFDPFS